jgi:lysophospholipase L1-like esterase
VQPPADLPAAGYLADYLVFWGVWVGVVGATWAFFRFVPLRHRKLVVGNALVFAAMLWSVVLAAETYLRYGYDGTDSYGLTMTNRAWFGRHVERNELGLRDSEFQFVKPPGVQRVAFVGDSFTFGYGVERTDDLFPRRVGHLLERQGLRRFETWNLGIVGANTAQEAALIEQATPEWGVNHVVLAYCLNDVEDLLPPERRPDRRTVPRPTWVAPWRSFLADFLWFRVRMQSDDRVRGYFDWVLEAYEDPECWSQQKARFRRIADHCRRTGTRLDVAVFPFFGSWGSGYGFHEAHDKTAAAWKELDVRVLDLRATYRGIPASDLMVSRFDAHPNESAHALAAEAIAKRVFGTR